MSSDSKALSHRRRRRRAGRPEVATAQDPLAGGRAGRRLEPGRAAEVDRGGLPVLGRRTTIGASREALLNRFAQFTTEIDGLDIHFLHVRSPHPDAMPLIITHGWPGSVVEFHKVIEPLVDPAAHGGDPADAFHVVCPSLPGFGFSDKPKTTGWGIDRIAAAWAKLMDRLGYARYGAQGGDWGSAVTTSLGAQDARALRRHPHHAGHGGAAEGRGRTDAGGGAGAQGDQILRRLGLRLLQAAIDPAADRGLRPDRFARRPGGVDPREVLGVDRLRRPPREHPRPRRVARQRHAVLGDRVGGVVGAALLGELRSGAADHPQGRRADRRGGVSRARSSRRCGAGWKATSPTSATGTRCPRAGTSPPSSKPGAVRRRRARLLSARAAATGGRAPRPSAARPRSSNIRSAAASRDGPARRPSARRSRLRRSRSGSASACRDR